MGTALTVLNSNAIQEGGLGVDFGSKLLRLNAATLFIVQKNSNIEGGIQGNLKIGGTSIQSPELWATLLDMPTEGRQYHIGDRSEMNRTPENLMCFSSDMIVPHPKARIPQAVNCANCARADWGPWREYKEKNNGQTNKALIPPCDASYKALLIEDQYKFPLQMFIRSDAKGPFEDGMQSLARELAILKAQGKNPNIFDVRFKITTKLVTKGKYTYYIPVFSDFKPVTEEQRQKFGEVYLTYVAQKKSVQSANAALPDTYEVDESVIEGQYVTSSETEDKEIEI